MGKRRAPVPANRRLVGCAGWVYKYVLNLQWRYYEKPSALSSDVLEFGKEEHGSRGGSIACVVGVVAVSSCRRCDKLMVAVCDLRRGVKGRGG